VEPMTARTSVATHRHHVSRRHRPTDGRTRRNLVDVADVLFETPSEHSLRGRNRQDCQASTVVSDETEASFSRDRHENTIEVHARTRLRALSGRAPTISPSRNKRRMTNRPKSTTDWANR
jgi:hypothetical protein